MIANTQRNNKFNYYYFRFFLIPLGVILVLTAFSVHTVRNLGASNKDLSSLSKSDFAKLERIQHELILMKQQNEEMKVWNFKVNSEKYIKAKRLVEKRNYLTAKEQMIINKANNKSWTQSFLNLIGIGWVYSNIRMKHPFSHNLVENDIMKIKEGWKVK